MAVYCMADIHGRLDVFHQMLCKIHFSSRDQLYIIGDVIDRGEQGIELLQEIMEMSNVKLILGNHEYMMLRHFFPPDEPDFRDPWVNNPRNGGLVTLRRFETLSHEDQQQILQFLKSLPCECRLTVEGKKYYLVHGCPAESVHDKVWHRPDPRMEAPEEGVQVILGHTPVPLLRFQKDTDQDAYFRDIIRKKHHVEIFHAPGFMDIDCGCGHEAPGCCLACICLNDGKEFYVPSTMTKFY